ncbi:hypothetical protein XPN_3706, partial [Xanthomonas arboricola pv. pruni MAFF 301427]
RGARIAARRQPGDGGCAAARQHGACHGPAAYGV